MKFTFRTLLNMKQIPSRACWRDIVQVDDHNPFQLFQNVLILNRTSEDLVCVVQTSTLLVMTPC
jgi:hypothetical protein